MPNRGGRDRGGKSWKNRGQGDHYEHDDRHSNNTRRVSFKTTTNKRKNQYESWKTRTNLLLDDDIDMGASAGGQMMRKPGRGRGGRMNSPAPRQHMVKRKFIAGMMPWYQIIIPYGAKHEKDVILKALLGYLSPDIFIPHYYKISGNAAIFYVDDVKIAEKLFNADRKIVMSDGFKLMVIVKNSVPNVTIDDELKEKMKLAMAKRYNPATKALDLTKFHADPELADIFCALFRPMIMLAAIDIIAENIPDLEALNLNDNKLHGLEHLKILSTKLKSLKILYMGDNRIPFLGSLDPLKSLPLVELFLKGNPLVNRFDDHEIYISDVRKKFPKLTRLDGVDLPPAIGFDVTDEVVLPPRQQSFLVNPAGQDLVRDFLTQYFAIYDSESRQPLLEAYHENALMSLASNYLSNDNRNSPNTRDFLTQYFAIYDSESRQPLLEAYHENALMSLASNYLSNDNRNSPNTRLNAYISHSRNIVRVTERESRRKYIRTGRLQVVTFLSELPKTKHDLMGFAVDLIVFTSIVRVTERESRRKYIRTGRLQVVTFLSELPKTKHDLMGFAVDLIVFTPQMITLSMNGVFKEPAVSGSPTRSFHRTFVIVPNASGGFCIVNDMLYVTNTTSEQEDKAFSSGETPVPAPTPAPVVNAPAVIPAPGVVAEEQQQQLVALLSAQTGMNNHWSVNCLQETQWDLQRALFIFNQLHSEGKIPPDAFIK
ncbi:tap, RNA-binding domain-containing protein [Phthorimaea operculella]|nr:tap, RNA-binding domain-containing protein [Phthorimaea operculella]